VVALIMIALAAAPLSAHGAAPTPMITVMIEAWPTGI
jgi:hypothetical protein